MTSVISKQEYEMKANNNLRVSSTIVNAARDIINNIDNTVVTEETFWSTLYETLSSFGNLNRSLLNQRNDIQEKIDQWHKDNNNNSNENGTFDMKAYISFLKDIGYLRQENEEKVNIVTENVDPEISLVAGPQLVVPADNARYALNAANARWGNLFDALYGTNIINSKPPQSKIYDNNRGQKVFKYCNALLNEIVPLASNVKYDDVVEFQVEKNSDNNDFELKCITTGNNNNSTTAYLANSAQFIGFKKNKDLCLESILLKNNGLHIIINIDKNDTIGKTHNAGIKSIVLEAAVSTIIDFEDSVAAVDAEDKANIYRNYAGLMKGDLSAKVRDFTRTLKGDKTFTSSSPNDGVIRLKGRSLLLCRNVGIHMYTNAVEWKDENGNYTQIPEGVLDLWFTCLGGLNDLQKNGQGNCNSKCGSIYIVKPKMHGPDEVKFVIGLFETAEKAFKIPQNTLKIGIMDEERRTTVNLKECLRHASERVVFINTGFLDRTGDEIHTSMEAGIMLPKGQIAVATWRKAYEAWNVDVGIETNLVGKGQIGKGMWAEPDNLLGLLKTKHVHPLSGAICAWVPSPTGATIHAIHYHVNNVFAIVDRISVLRERNDRNLMDILTPPLVSGSNNELSQRTIEKEINTAVQAILGYVSRWVGQGVGCSKVPDLNNIGKMEDRATLRISSQLLANWLHHKVCSEDQIKKAFEYWATIVDEQNIKDNNYVKMSGVKNSNAYM